MHFKRGTTTPEVIRLVLRVNFAQYLAFPVYLVGILTYGHLRFRSASTVAELALLALLLAGGLVDLRRARRQQWERFRPPTACLQACIAVVFVTIVNASAHGNPSVYRVFLILPAMSTAVFGDAVMMTIVGVLTMASFGIVTQAAYHSASTTFWTLAFWSLALLAIVLSIHLLVSKMVELVDIGGALRRIADHRMSEAGWPRELAPVLPDVAAALECTRVEAVAVDRHDTAAAAATLVARWPEVPDGPWAPPDGHDWHGLVAAGTPVRVGDVLLVPVPVAAGPHVVLVATGSVHGASAVFGEDQATAQLVAGLVAGMADRANLVDTLRTEGRTDALTGLANRRAIDEFLPRELAHHRRTGEPLSVAMVDLDDFKRYNDELGHSRGDQLLRSLAERMRRRARDSDLVARYGGEEFLLILTVTDASGATKLLEALRALGPLGDATHPTTFSAGVAQWDRVESADALVRRADGALYEAKRAGKNRVVAAREPERSRP